MHDTDDFGGTIHQTAAAWFHVKIVNGAIPSVVQGGPIDGLQYFEVEIDGIKYWLVEDALLEAPELGSVWRPLT